MISSFFSRAVDFDVLPMASAHCDEAAAIHAARFARAWSADEIDALLGQTNVHGFVIQPSGSGRRTLDGFVLVRMAADEAEILTIGVREKQQNRGLGWRLMNAAIRTARNEGAQAMFLEVDETNQRAIALYRKLGFFEVARRQAYYFHKDGARTAALVMRLDLN